jgi:3-hydroxyisobutyrate dehydrogenase-like beta-hydroxyacid dehydrogenase
VSGGTKGAADGTLTIMVGGEDEALQKAKPVLEGCFLQLSFSILFVRV